MQIDSSNSENQSYSGRRGGGDTSSKALTGKNGKAGKDITTTKSGGSKKKVTATVTNDNK